MKYIVYPAILFLLLPSALSAQSSFIDYQKSQGKVADVFRRKEDTLKRQFAAKQLEWPSKFVYIRSFKYDSELEVWAKNRVEDAYKLVKTYKICALAGTMGPKRIEGDYQVPEGFYHITEFKPNSQYHLSLGLNYPNASDRILADSLQPGGEIYIHGSCVTQGCIPITNSQIEELYMITSYARGQGQDFIPVHIFPVRFNKPRSMAYLDKLMRDDAELRIFEKTLKQAFDYFEVTRQLPVIGVSSKGDYILY